MATIVRGRQTEKIRPATGWHPDLDPPPFANNAAARQAAISFIGSITDIPSFNYPFPYDIHSLGKHTFLTPEDILPDVSIRQRFAAIKLSEIKQGDKVIGHNIKLQYSPYFGGIQFVINIRYDAHPNGPSEWRFGIVESWDVRISSSGKQLTKAGVGQHFVVQRS